MRVRALLAAAGGTVLTAVLATAAFAGPPTLGGSSTSGSDSSGSDSSGSDARDRVVAPGAGLGTRAAAATADATTFMYVYGRQSVATDGASVDIEQAAPTLASGDFHSLAELAVQSADGSQIVEVGWTVDQAVNGDLDPHLFVYHWVDGQPSCYNGCGFVATSDTVRAGDAVPVGDTGTFQIVHDSGQWQTWYDGTQLGYFPDSLWDNGYTRAGLVQTFGEVAATGTDSCTDMGNGTFGDADGSAQISDFALINGSADPSLSVFETNSTSYDSGATTATGFRFGGPGAC